MEGFLAVGHRRQIMTAKMAFKVLTFSQQVLVAFVEFVITNGAV
jgi:hypothetical protein